MGSIKSNIAKNICELRKSKKWTQGDLAYNLNYSDKAISKWERGDATPDIETLYDIATLFDVSIDYLLDDNPSQNAKFATKKSKALVKELSILGLLIVSVFFVATAIFVFGFLENFPIKGNLWICYIWALPISVLIAYFYLRKKRIKLLTLICTSLFVWTLLTAIYLQSLLANVNFWPIFFIGVPIQIALFLFHFVKN